MKIADYARVTLVAIALCNAAGANAAVLAFNGSATATAMVGSDPTCAPLPFRAIVTDGPGTSSLGSFTYSHNACTLGATGPVNGSFVLNFGGSLLNGAFEGVAIARVGVAGLFDQLFTYTVGGGSGVFQGATGTFTNVGTVDVRGGPPSRLALNFNGLINAPAVPEPASWSMMLIGFGAAGWSLRRLRVQPTALSKQMHLSLSELS